MPPETDSALNALPSAQDARQYLPWELQVQRDAVPPCRHLRHVPAAYAFLLSLLIHACVIAGSVLLHELPPIALPVREAIEIRLVSLPSLVPGMPSSETSADEAHAETPPATEPPASMRVELASTGVQAKKERSARQSPKRIFEENTRADAGKDTPSAGSSHNVSGWGAGNGRQDAGSGSPPVPFGSSVNPWPTYPELARQRGQEGQVVLLVSVDALGNPAKVSLEASSTHTLLDQAAITAILRWKFTPASRNGEAVPGTVRVPVTFRLQ